MEDLSGLMKVTLSPASSKRPARSGEDLFGSIKSFEDPEPTVLAPGFSQNRPTRVSQPFSDRRPFSRCFCQARMDSKYSGPAALRLALHPVSSKKTVIPMENRDIVQAYYLTQLYHRGSCTTFRRRR